VTVLRNMLEDPDEKVRESAIEAIRRVGSEHI